MPLDMKKLKDYAGGKQNEKKPFPPKMKGYGGKGMHAPIVGNKDKQDDEDEHKDAGDEGGEKKDVDIDALAAEIEAGNGNKQLAKMMQGYDDEENPVPSFVLDEDVWNEAKEMVDPENCDYENPWLVCGAVYEALGGEIKQQGKGFPPKKKDKKDESEHHDDDSDDEDEDEDDE
jgi:hypothetical protein